MDFVLRYRGRLPSRSKRTTEDKQRIREHLHPQLLELCRREGRFGPATQELEEAPLKGSRLEPDRPLGNNLFRKTEVAGLDYVPLVSRPHQLACELEILWLRHERRGRIVHSGGDLDNRLKNLLDGLRIPHHDDEVYGEGPDVAGDRCYCLLEDDALIEKLNINTHRLLEPEDSDLAEDRVDLFIHVNVVATKSIMANVGFGL